jgi:hypothetical protein
MNARQAALRGALTFAIVVGIGFALGPVRVLGLEPRLGTRTAELVEAPFMLAAVLLAGRWVGRRLCSGRSAGFRLGVGFAAAGLVLAADTLVGVGLRDMTLADVFLRRNPVAGTVYHALVALTAIAPWWFGGAARELRATSTG